MNCNNSIDKESEYKRAMKRIELLMNKGSGNLTESELDEIKELALAVQSYEKQIYSL